MGRILFACANQDLARDVEQVVTQQQAQADIIVSSRSAVLQDIQDLGKEFDVIVSRGAMGQYIAQNTNYHVLLMRISLIDILRKVDELRQVGANKIAVIGSSAWLGEDIHQEEHQVLNFHFILAEDNEVREKIIASLPASGYDALITVGTGVEQALEHGLLVRELTTSMASIQSCLTEAQFIAGIIREERLRSKQTRFLLDNSEDALVMFTHDRVYYANTPAKGLFQTTNINASDVEPYLDMHNATGKVGETQVLINSSAYSMDDDEYGYIISFKKTASIHKAEQVIRQAHQKGFVAKYSFYNIISESPVMKHCIEQAIECAQFDSSVLITGETGTGKELIAQSIHNASSRRNQPFVSINCSALPANLLESELFGYVDGAFTGAKKSGKYGMFELADSGTLFLDEIGDMPVELQSRILRVLQEKELMRIGGDKIIPVNVRLICATNRNLLQCVENGTFRADLYYRINVLRMMLPPLRERKADILPLFEYHLQLLCAKYKKNVKLVDKEACDALTQYAWPGNIRELMNAAERAVVLCKEGEITADFLNEVLADRAEEAVVSAEPKEIRLNRAKITSKDIERMLRFYSHAEICEMLGISRSTLWRIQNKK